MHLLASQTATHLFTMGIPVVEKVLRTVGVYVGLVALLRLAGKRDLAQLNSFDLVVLLLLSNVVQNAVIGDETSLTGGLLGAAVLVGLNAVVVRVTARSRLLAAALEGSETCVIEDGKMLDDALTKLGLRPEEVTGALRRQGANTVAEVERAVLTPGGSIDVILKQGDENATKGDVDRLEREIAMLDAKLDRLLAASG